MKQYPDRLAWLDNELSKLEANIKSAPIEQPLPIVAKPSFPITKCPTGARTMAPPKIRKPATGIRAARKLEVSLSIADTYEHDGKHVAKRYVRKRF